jgi:hypothetical protein
LGRSKPPKAALRGSPRPALRSHPGNPAQRARRGKAEGRAEPPRHQLGHTPGDRDPRKGLVRRRGALQRQRGHGCQAGSGLLEDKRVGVQEDGAEAAAPRRHGVALHLPPEQAPGMAPGTVATTRGLKRFVKKGSVSPDDAVWSCVGSLSTGTEAPWSPQLFCAVVQQQRPFRSRLLRRDGSSRACSRRRTRKKGNRVARRRFRRVDQDAYAGGRAPQEGGVTEVAETDPPFCES